MQDETTPPVPVKDIPLQSTQPVAAPIVAPVDAPSEPLKEPPIVKEEAPAKEQKVAAARHAQGGIIPVVFSIVIFVALAACAYFAFKGM